MPVLYAVHFKIRLSAVSICGANAAIANAPSTLSASSAKTERRRDFSRRLDNLVGDQIAVAAGIQRRSWRTLWFDWFASASAETAID
jgi:hypothetical protein